MHRKTLIQNIISQPDFDVVVMGGGINGASVFRALVMQGYRVLLLDKADFAAGTSQSSGMMIWGGLLYLRNFEFKSVSAFSADRDHMLEQHHEWLKPKLMRYVNRKIIGHRGRSKWWVHTGLWLYWLFSKGKRQTPKSSDAYPERDLLIETGLNGSLSYEEAFINDSDARYVYRCLTSKQSSTSMAINYVSATGVFNAKESLWQLQLSDQLSNDKSILGNITCKLMVNSAGVWTDAVNAAFRIKSRYKHVLSKGVYLCLKREPTHHTALFYDLGEHDDVISHLPWGPVALWGPTETMAYDIEQESKVSAADIDYLIKQYNQRYKTPITPQDIIGLRCGLRPLAVNQDFQASTYPLDISRHHEVMVDQSKPWIACYGGKITGSHRLATDVLMQVKKIVTPRVKPAPEEPATPLICDDWITFPGLHEPVPSPSWCMMNEHCQRLDDYLRRRTNIAQWIANGGFGVHDEHDNLLYQFALDLSEKNIEKARAELNRYRQQVKAEQQALNQMKEQST